MSEDRRLSNKVVLITGATGIAAATARLAAGQGARVFVADLGAEHAPALAREIQSAGGTSEHTQADLRDSAQADAAVARCVQAFGRIDGVFNVAGISGRRLGDGPLHECTDAGWITTMDANVKSMFFMCRAVLRQMLAQPPGASGQRGAILNMSSVLADSPSPQHFTTHAYAASKAAITGLTIAAAAYYAPHQIRVNAVAPGLVRTPMSERAQQNPDILNFMKTKQPLAGDLIDANAVARAAVFLLSDEACMTTGQVFTVDAGWRVSEGR